LAAGFRAAPDLPRSFFILAAFGWSGTTGADHTDPLAPFSEHNDQEALAPRLGEEDEARLFAGVPGIVYNAAEWVRERAHRLLERHATRHAILTGFGRIHSKVAMREC